MVKIISLFLFNMAFSQNILDYNLRYNNNNEDMIVNYYNLDFVYKNNPNSKLFIYNKDSLLFKEQINKNNYINVFLIDKKTISNQLLNYEVFEKNNKNDTIQNNYKEKHLQNIIYYNLNEKYFLKFEIKSNYKKVYFPNIEENLNLNFNNYIKNSNSINNILSLLDFYYPKDYNYHIDLVTKLKKEPEKNSLVESVIIDLKTNNNNYKPKIRRKKLPIEKNELLENAENFVDNISSNYDIIMFNEYHQLPHTRFNFMYFLKKLKEKGFNYLALETLDAPNNESEILPNKISGYYLDEPNCALMVSYAQKLGFKFVSYEENENQCKEYNGNSGTCRDSIQALNLKNLYKFDNKARLIVLGGHAHIEKKERSDAWKFTRVFLDEMLPNKKIVSIGQTKYISTNLETNDIETSFPLVYKLEDNQFDYNIISPYYEKYYNWFYHKNHLMNNEIKIKNIDFASIEIYSIFKGEILKYPIFRANKENLIGSSIFLPKEIKYKIIYKDINNKIL
jgi:hypothetical protein